MARAIMIQGAGSNVGKSLLVAGIARAALRKGIAVAPFKPQNMSNNAAVTSDGGEIGRAQALQARAAGRAPHSDMNPVLLKPESETGAQIILQGRRHATLKARAYAQMRESLMPRVLESFHRLAGTADLLLVEGAGSPAEINLRKGDLANMGFAEAADLPVILVGDIDRGGVIAQLVGTHAVLSPEDRSRIKAFVINKFRGDPALFAEGEAEIARRTCWEALGVLPWFEDAWRLPAEDMLDLQAASGAGRDAEGASGPAGGKIVKIAVPQFSRMANFDDLDPLVAEPRVQLEIIPPGKALPADADLVLLPGTKSTIGDLAAFRENGWDIDLLAHWRRGGRVLGLCGGYQMLGREISDPLGLEGAPRTVPGLGLLDLRTEIRAQKCLCISEGICLENGAALQGYEIHLGETTGPDCARPWLQVSGRPHGARSADGRVRGCYLHGIFASDAFRAAFIEDLGARAGDLGHDQAVEQTLDALAMHVERHLDLDRLLEMAAPLR